MILAIVDDLAQDGGLHVGQGDLLICARVVDHIPHQRGHAGHLGLDLKDLALGRFQQDLVALGHLEGTEPLRAALTHCRPQFEPRTAEEKHFQRAALERAEWHPAQFRPGRSVCVKLPKYSTATNLS